MVIFDFDSRIVLKWFGVNCFNMMCYCHSRGQRDTVSPATLLTNSISNRKQLSLSTPLTLSYQEYQIIVTNRVGKASITASITFRIQLVLNVLLVTPLYVNAVSLVLLLGDMLRHLYNVI